MDMLRVVLAQGDFKQILTRGVSMYNLRVMLSKRVMTTTTAVDMSPVAQQQIQATSLSIDVDRSLQILGCVCGQPAPAGVSMTFMDRLWLKPAKRKRSQVNSSAAVALPIPPTPDHSHLPQAEMLPDFAARADANHDALVKLAWPHFIRVSGIICLTSWSRACELLGPTMSSSSLSKLISGGYANSKNPNTRRIMDNTVWDAIAAWHLSTGTEPSAGVFVT